ncbi:hypothetical protein GCK72_024760 [Caenorhabditis remanei]|uniref:Uncharacterized protein n=1 Tax=Caenorhabditis remanei TaxID=31234 RepID=A0A6A5G0G5_CAERE|nr:hypothetical protein GCK72_024760 [Caenorhabditis remanei]KAF1748293.1 hypothetical protein GCK72_024760 [Caenorhabditis remanei]
MSQDLRSFSVNACQFTLRATLLLFSLAVVCLYAAIIYLEHSYPRIAPYHRRKLVYVCFPEEDSTVTYYMGVIRNMDIVLSIALAILCVILAATSSLPRVHWPIFFISLIRFIFVYTQLDFILSARQGICKVNGDQMEAFHALIILFTVRCIKGYITINMSTLCYGNSILIYLFGLKSPPENVDGEEEHELDDFPVDRTHLTV